MLHISVADSRVRSLMVFFYLFFFSLWPCTWVQMGFVIVVCKRKIIIRVNTDSCWKLVVILRWNYPRSTLGFEINTVSHSVSQSMIHSNIDWWHWLENTILTNSEWDYQHYQVCRHTSVVRDRTLLILSYVFVLNQVTRCSLSFSMARLSG